MLTASVHYGNYQTKILPLCLSSNKKQEFKIHLMCVCTEPLDVKMLFLFVLFIVILDHYCSNFLLLFTCWELYFPTNGGI